MIQKKGGITTEGVLIFLLFAFVFLGSIITNKEPSGQAYSLPDECNDGVDNDGDGLVDLNGPKNFYGDNAYGEKGDPGCLSVSDSSEKGSVVDLPCDDGTDNDGDSGIDYQADGSGDQQCMSAEDMSESN